MAGGMHMADEVFDAGTPQGFRSMMSRNRQAMDVFIGLPEAERQKLIEGSRSMHSKKEMQNYVNQIGGFKTPHGPVQL